MRAISQHGTPGQPRTFVHLSKILYTAWLSTFPSAVSPHFTCPATVRTGVPRSTTPTFGRFSLVGNALQLLLQPLYALFVSKATGTNTFGNGSRLTATAGLLIHGAAKGGQSLSNTNAKIDNQPQTSAGPPECTRIYIPKRAPWAVGRNYDLINMIKPERCKSSHWPAP